MSFKNQIIYEDNHLLVINKIAGQLVQGDKTGDATLIDLMKDYLRVTYNKQGNIFAGLCHRLDRPTSGIVVFAKTSKALTRVNKLFLDKKVDKTYLAVVKGKVDKKPVRLSDYLLKNQKQNKSYVVSKDKKGAKLAILTYQLQKQLDSYAILKVNLETGRHHQIRAQLANKNLIIKGDLKYSAKRSNEDASIHLHASEISFIHPVKKEPMHLKCKPISKDKIWKYL